MPGLALAAAALRAEGRQRHALDPALVGDGDDHVLALDQLLDVDVGLGVEVDEGAARGVELLLDPRAARPSSPRAAARASAGSAAAPAILLRDLLELVGELVALERRSGAAGAARGWPSPARPTAGSRRRRPGAAASPSSASTSRISGRMSASGQVARHQLGARPSAGRAAARISAMTSSMLATATTRPTRMCARSRALARSKRGAAGDDLLAEGDERLQHLLEAQQLGPAAAQRDHVDAEAGLQRRELEELVEHDVGVGVALELDDDAHAVAVALVAQVGDALDAASRAPPRRSARPCAPC